MPHIPSLYRLNLTAYVTIESFPPWPLVYCIRFANSHCLRHHSLPPWSRTRCGSYTAYKMHPWAYDRTNKMLQQSPRAPVKNFLVEGLEARQSRRAYSRRPRSFQATWYYICVRSSHETVLLLIDIQCPCLFFTLERYKLCGHKLRHRDNTSDLKKWYHRICCWGVCYLTYPEW